MSKVVEPDWHADDFDSWGDPDEWPPSWRIKATAALIRHFSRIPVEPEKTPDGWRVSMPHRSPWTSGNRRTALLETMAFLDGFQNACELMAAQWDCRERTDDAA